MKLFIVYISYPLLPGPKYTKICQNTGCNSETHYIVSSKHNEWQVIYKPIYCRCRYIIARCFASVYCHLCHQCGSTREITQPHKHATCQVLMKPHSRSSNLLNHKRLVTSCLTLLSHEMLELPSFMVLLLYQ